MTETGGRRRGGNRRDEILDAALKLFAQKGMAQVTTRQIAQAVGISQPSLYAHFRSADEIASELCARAFATLTDVLAQVADEDAAPIDRLRRMARAYIEFGLAHPDMYRVAFMLEDAQGCIAEPVPADGEPLDPVLEAGLRCFGQLHRVVLEHTQSDDEQTLLLSQSTWAHVHGLVSLLIARSEFPWAARERLIDEHLRRLHF